MAEQMALGIVAPPTTRCGYCGRPLTRQADGFGCTPCREAMARTIVGPTEAEAIAQWRAFERAAAR